MRSLKATFLILYPISLICLLIESITFKYFILKHFYVNTDVLMGIVFLIMIFMFISLFNSRKRHSDKLVELYLYFSKLIFVIISIFYLLLTFLDGLKYQNYVFYKYHVQPELLIRPITLVLFFIVAYHIFKYNKLLRLNEGLLKVFLSTTLFVLVIVFGLSNTFVDISNMQTSFITVLKTINLSKENKYEYVMRSQYGYYFDYMEFVKSVTPSNASILLPPQKNPWQFEGNQRLDRFFLYPRTLYSVNEESSSESHDYVLIAWGSEGFPPSNGDLYGWPQYNIKAKQVYIFDINSKTYKVYDGNYDPKIYLKSNTFGLIKIK